MRRLTGAAIVVCLLASAVAIAVAVQQRGVAAEWRSLERRRQHAATQILDDQSRKLDELRKDRDDLQRKLDELAAQRAAHGDETAALSVLAARGIQVRDRLDACGAWSPASGVPAACRAAADEAQQLLGALHRVATDP